MAGDLVRFVDSIAASPTVRLNVNDEVTWWVKSFSAPPPRLRRSMSANAMRDGVHVSASSYESRTVTLELEVRTSTQDATATAMQALWRELDRSDNYLMYQPTGSTKPVFFRLYRSDASQLEDVFSQAAMRRITIDLLAEPFALGLKESLGPFTVNNDPANATNPTYFDVVGAIGDVSTPLVWWDLSGHQRRIVATQHAATAAALKHVWLQAEAGTVSLDTSNPGGGPDAAMSGAGVNNYTRTTFAGSPTMNERAGWPTSAGGLDQTGQWRVIAFVRKNGTTSTLTVRTAYTAGVGVAAVTGPTKTVVPGTSGRLALDLGVFTFNDGDARTPGYSTVQNGISSGSLSFQAARSGGTDTLDWDAFLLIPAGGQSHTIAPTTTAAVDAASLRALIDAVDDRVSGLATAGDPTSGAASMNWIPATASGALPNVIPGALVANRYHVVPSATSDTSSVDTTTAVSLAYWPRYLHARPSAT